MSRRTPRRHLKFKLHETEEGRGSPRKFLKFKFHHELFHGEYSSAPFGLRTPLCRMFLLRSEFQNEFRSRSLKSKDCMVFLRSAFRRELWEQIVPVPKVLPLERISERIQKQTVDVPLPQTIPQKRISERAGEQIVDVVPGPPGGGTLRAAPAVRQQLPECPDDGFFSHLSPEEKKSDDWAAVECELGVALELIHAVSL